MSTTSGVSGSGSNVWAALNTPRTNHQAKMFAKVDSDSSGSVDQAELTTMLGKISEKTGADFGDAAKVFTSMDANSDGSLSSEELNTGMKSLMQSQSSTVDFAQARKSDGSASTTYDPLDTNQDGTVSLAERLAGSDQGDAVQALFKAMDADNNGKISSSESDTFAKKLTDLASQAADNSSTATTDSQSSQGFDIAKLAQMLYDQVAGGLATSNKSGALSAVA